MIRPVIETSHPSSLLVRRAQGRLANALQEAFTIAVRLRANRAVADEATSFRAHIKQLLAAADRDARAAGYDAESVKLAVYAYIAFLDESVLNSRQPVFAEWFRQPLQEEVFGEHVAGETFFRYAHDLVGRQDSDEVADVLEVYLLCLLLGFQGRYGSAPGELQGFVSGIRAKIARIRGGVAPLSPAWAPPEGEVGARQRDPWIRRLGIAAIATVALALLLFLGFRLALHGAASEIRNVSSQVAS